MVSKTGVDGYLEAIGEFPANIHAGVVLEVKIEIRRRVVVEVIAHQKNALHGRMQSVDEVARSREPFRGFEDGLGIERVAFGSAIEIVDDMCVGDHGKVKVAPLVGTSGCDRKRVTKESGTGKGTCPQAQQIPACGRKSFKRCH